MVFCFRWEGNEDYFSKSEAERLCGHDTRLWNSRRPFSSGFALPLTVALPCCGQTLNLYFPHSSNRSITKISTLIVEAGSDHNRPIHSIKPHMDFNPFSLFPDCCIIFTFTLISIVCGGFHSYVDELLCFYLNDYSSLFVSGGCVIGLFENDEWKLASISQPNSLVCDNLCYWSDRRNSQTSG